MIKITKDINDVPESLKPATKTFFSNEKYPATVQGTHQARERSVNEKEFKGRAYAKKDVRKKLEKIYKRCAYCECSLVGSEDIEHYRPKSKYYWLALSWDNLLLSCRECNSKKNDDFDIQGTEVAYDPADHQNWDLIHKLGEKYDAIERPLLINPERDEDPLRHFEFSRDGEIKGITAEGKYTREKCYLYRDKLNEERKAVLDAFEHRIMLDYRAHRKDREALKRAFKTSLKEYETIDPEKANENYIAFRRYSIMKGWHRMIIKECNSRSSQK